MDSVCESVIAKAVEDTAVVRDLFARVEGRGKKARRRRDRTFAALQAVVEGHIADARRARPGSAELVSATDGATAAMAALDDFHAGRQR